VPPTCCFCVASASPSAAALSVDVLFAAGQVGAVSVRVGFDGSPCSLVTMTGDEIRFDPIAGDSASFESDIDVQLVPEPGTALLMGLG